jgi:hypothetical protein
MSSQDARLDAVVELEDLIRRLRVLKHTLAQDIANERERWKREMVENDEHIARMGMPCTSPLPYEALTHTVALDPDDVDLIDRCAE